jgi:purine-cytosine permease-like protein
VLGVILGAAFGTLFMCFHANQGPTMGLPQMIQSRAQWGIRGAIVPFIAVVFVYIGFNVFDLILGAKCFQTILPGSNLVWYVILAVVAIIIAIVGFDLLMFVQRWLCYFLVIAYAIVTAKALISLDLGSQIPHGGSFSAASLLICFAAAAGYQISYAVYVSDYSRYLPERSNSAGVIWWTYLGAAGSAIWLMSLGAILGSALPSTDAVTTVQKVGDSVFSGFGTFVVLVSALALITIMSVNSYGAMLTSASAVDAFKPIKPTRRVRVIGIVAILAIAFIVALVIPSNYLGSFNNFVTLMLYFLVPWTAVNLVDFYFVRHGHYAISDLFNPRGIYHLWAWRGLTAYIVGLLCMIPFFKLTFFDGPATQALHGADISWGIGLAVAGGLYYVFSLNIDTAVERRAIEDSEATIRDTTS